MFVPFVLIWRVKPNLTNERLYVLTSFLFSVCNFAATDRPIAREINWVCVSLSLTDPDMEKAFLISATT